MYDIFEGIRSLIKLDEVCIDNSVFRLHYKATMVLLMAFSLINTSRQYLGDPINCIVEDIPQTIMNTYCWISTTFTLPHKFGRIGIDVIHQGLANYIPDQDEVKHHKYYQWVCFILFFQAILFYVPRYMWKMWEGGKARSLTRDLKMVSMDPKTMNIRCKILCEYFQRNIAHHNLYFFRYFCCEVLNLFNVIGQIFLMNRFLNYEFSNYGWDVITFMGMDIEERIDPMSNIFPKLAKCSFHKYGPSGSIEKRDGLCLLPINVFNEKIYVFMWFWFIILAGLTTLSVIYRLAIITSSRLRLFLLTSKFRIASSEDIKLICQRFQIGDWFIFYQVSKNVDQFAFKHLISKLAKSMKEKETDFDDEETKVYKLGYLMEDDEEDAVEV